MAATAGYLSDFPVERIYRDMRVCQIYEGASDIQKILHRTRAGLKQMSKQMLSAQRPADCPCGGAAPDQRSGAKVPRFAQCCGRYIDGGETALRSPNLVSIGTLGKAAGVSGAFVVAHNTVIEWLVQRARPYIFTTASVPAATHAVSASLRIIGGEEGDARRAHLQKLIERTHAMLKSTPWLPVDSYTAVQPLITGTNETTLDIAAALDRAGLWVPAIRPPTVPTGTSRLRISLSAAHSQADLDRLEAGLQQLGVNVA